MSDKKHDALWSLNQYSSSSSDDDSVNSENQNQDEEGDDCYSDAETFISSVYPDNEVRGETNFVMTPFGPRDPNEIVILNPGSSSSDTEDSESEKSEVNYPCYTIEEDGTTDFESIKCASTGTMNDLVEDDDFKVGQICIYLKSNFRVF